MGLFGLKKSGITKKTPKNLLLGAGTIYKNLKWDDDKKQWSGTVIGATSGGNKFTWKPNIIDIEIDGATVKTKGLTQKQGDEASLEINLVEITPESLAMAMLGEQTQSDATGFAKVQAKSVITDDAYLDNVAYVGFTSADLPIVIIMENALCTSGLELSGKNKENTVIPCTFEPYADFGEDASQDKLPVFLYYPLGTDNNSGTTTPTTTYTEVTPTGNENPSEQGWYEKSGDNYVLTEDTTVDSGKTYYEATNG